MNFSRFEYLCDTFGPRYRGTPGLTNALAWIVETMKDDGASFDAQLRAGR